MAFPPLVRLKCHPLHGTSRRMARRYLEGVLDWAHGTFVSGMANCAGRHVDIRDR